MPVYPGAQTYPLLPNVQGDRRDLARQREARHRWLHASGNASLVEILERSAAGSRSCSSAFEDVFQIVIVVLVQSANGQDLLGALQLATHEAVFSTGVSLQRQAAVGPQLPLGTQALRR